MRSSLSKFVLDFGEEHQQNISNVNIPELKDRSDYHTKVDNYIY